MNTNRLLAAVLVLQVVTLAGLWAERPGAYVNDARADLPPDPGAQRVQLVDEMKSMNAKMDRLLGVLESGKLQVRVEGANNAANAKK